MIPVSPAGARPAGLPARDRHLNRLIPEVEIEGFTDVFSRRIAVFDKVAVVGVKKPVDVATVPENDEFAPQPRRQAYLAAGSSR